MRVERTRDTAKMPRAGFEDREDHRTPCASAPQPIAPGRFHSEHSGPGCASAKAEFFSAGCYLNRQRVRLGLFRPSSTQKTDCRMSHPLRRTRQCGCNWLLHRLWKNTFGRMPYWHERYFTVLVQQHRISERPASPAWRRFLFFTTARGGENGVACCSVVARWQLATLPLGPGRGRCRLWRSASDFCLGLAKT